MLRQSRVSLVGSLGAVVMLLGVTPGHARGDCSGMENFPLISAYLDIDGDTSTGGTMMVEQAGEAPHGEEGIDVRVRASLACDNGVVVVEDIRRDGWNGSDWGLGLIEAAGHPVGIGIGTASGDVIEFGFSRGNLPACIPRVVFHSSLFMLNDYTAPASLGACGSPLEIPSASDTGLLVLAGLLAFASLVVLKRFSGTSGLGVLFAVVGVALLASSAWAIAITVDGQVDDWAGELPIVTDPPDDQSSIYTAEDLLACFGTYDEGAAAFAVRCDVQDIYDTIMPP